jgi:hypothetical protein
MLLLVLEGPLSILCECADAECYERIELAASEYVKARGDSGQFVVLSGHEVAAVEEVVASRDSYLVVRKRR